MRSSRHSHRKEVFEVDEIDKRSFENDHLAWADLTLPGRCHRLGSLHPLTQVHQQLADLFLRMGFDLIYGGEIETVHYLFDTLQMKKTDPSRQAALYLNDALLLRTSPTSLVVRALEKRRPPVKVFCSGKCYQRDDSDEPLIRHRADALWVDRGLGFAQLKAVLQIVLDELFGKGFETQIHWTEGPSTRLSIQVQLRRKSASGNESPWRPILHAGLVETALLQEVDYDPEIYSGFIVGLVIEPIAMLKYGIDEPGIFYQNDVRFLEIF
jgi:phenylalanyl-tRNA synthetase alpha chain